eukprot:CAMPEP_0202886616 /NCGR_PEP_ID=MMETSP1391-20130828/42265_1 /ASSEMBLY_ACC=CAM_ASM_000867 /TAXON_ID=1034604 /ORGANISM="Chlamydomonas leiostraca, Strain SAG 11-49" /LENGTH=144 /DNA_ID=CAMNT_0049569891 /DNA_START=394 /DNA_END=828 /DNA_ORIENTATION=+
MCCVLTSVLVGLADCGDAWCCCLKYPLLFPLLTQPPAVLLCPFLGFPQLFQHILRDHIGAPVTPLHLLSGGEHVELLWRHKHLPHHALHAQLVPAVLDVRARAHHQLHVVLKPPVKPPLQVHDDEITAHHPSLPPRPPLRVVTR